MRRKKKNKEKKPILKRMQRKLWVVFGVLCILFVVLIGRLMYIEYTSGAKYEKIVLAQQDYSSTIIPYQRGDIIDAKGTVLATSVDVYNVILDCKVLNANDDKIDSTIRIVTDCFPEINGEDMRKALSDTPENPYVKLAKKVSYEEKQKCQEIMDDEEQGKQITGIWFEKEYIREYPYNNLASAVLGFSTSTTGVIGLENFYNSELSGVNGRSYGYQSEDNTLEQTVVEPVDGNVVQLTIDANIQTIVEDVLRRWNAEYQTKDDDGNVIMDGSKNASCVVMNPNTGEILAMATYPDFDLNNPRDLSKYFTEEEQALMSEDMKMDVLNQLWQNYAITHTFEPGSTFKPFTVAAGLETGTLTGAESFFCDGGEFISGSHIHCWKHEGHGELSVKGAIENSCNDALMQMSYMIGASNFSHYQSIFGFGQKTNIDLPGEASTASLMYDEEGLEKTINIATNSFGQNFNVTMVQLASAFCSVINGGHMYQPHVVSAILDKNHNVVRRVEPVVSKETISQETSDVLKDALLGVPVEGTGKLARIAGYNIGGKTGTAQKIPRDANTYVVSFIGFAPYVNPEVVVYVVIDEPNHEKQDQSNFAVACAHDIMLQLLPYMNIPTAAEEGYDPGVEFPEDTRNPVIYPGMNAPAESTTAAPSTEAQPAEAAETAPAEDGESGGNMGGEEATNPEIVNPEAAASNAEGYVTESMENGGAAQ